jgi:hypothetical protein
MPADVPWPHSVDGRARRTSGLGAMATSAAAVMLLVACGKSGSPSGSASAARQPDVTVKIDGTRHKCIVALAGEKQGNVIPCDDVVSFVKEELRVPGGSIYDIATVSAVDEASTTKVRAALDGAGYRPRD